MAARTQLDIDADDPRGVSIADAARVLGVPMPTLRSWELRYGIPELSRGSGQHRRYTPAGLQALRLMRDEIARGQKASVAAHLVLSLLGGEGQEVQFVRRILADSQRRDPPAIRACLDEAHATLGLAGCIDDVLLPAMRQVGEWWAVGHCDDVQERMTTEAVRSWLDRCSAFGPTPTEARPLILACGPTDLHTIGLECMALMLRYEGWPCRVLGARTSTETLAAATRATAAQAVIVVSHLATGRQRAVGSITAVHDLGVQVFYAGNAFSAGRSRRQVPGTYLGGSIADACALVVAMVARDDRRATATTGNPAELNPAAGQSVS